MAPMVDDGVPVGLSPSTAGEPVVKARTGTGRRRTKAGFLPQHARFLAHRLAIGADDDETVTTAVASSRVELMPHQVDAAIFALDSPLREGAILADEVGLGKTIEAGLVIAQRWAEGQRKILIIAPALLTPQLQQELHDRFDLPATVVADNDSRSDAAGMPGGSVLIMSYDRAFSLSGWVAGIAWDLVVIDEAHYLRNVDRGSAKRAKALRDALVGRRKLLLTATPVQNRFSDVAGLLSFLHSGWSIERPSFSRKRRLSDAEIELLRIALEPYCVRHLRADVVQAGFANYPDRYPVTLSYDTSEEEQRLYNLMSNYLAAPSLAFEQSNSLTLLNARKMIGSSVAAAMGFLRRVQERLEREGIAELDLDEDIDEIAVETAEDPVEAAVSGASRSGTPNEAEGPGTSRQALNELRQAEIARVNEMIVLAETIGSSTKTEVLVSQLPKLLDDVVTRGGQRKALIFTESKRTQQHLFDALSAAGFAGDIALVNGSNADPSSRQILQHWRASVSPQQHRDRATDMRAALVAAFRNDKAIMIATEAGAQGLNLQHCSLIINYDLPWNPQRVEQRIGRCHRFGQKIDVAVVNLVDRSNAAEVRILELLTEKFALFDKLFGVSDEILGDVMVDCDIEREILRILSRCRSAEEIDAAFDDLGQSLAEPVREAKETARRRLQQRFDPAVVTHLDGRKRHLEALARRYHGRLGRFIRSAFPKAIFDSADPLRFQLGRVQYHCESGQAQEAGIHHARLGNGGLFDRRIAFLRNAAPPRRRHIVFHLDGGDFDGGGRAGHLQSLRGKSGWYSVIVTRAVSALWTTERIAVVAITKSGKPVPAQLATSLFDLPGEERRFVPLPRRGALSAEVARATDAAHRDCERQRDAFLTERSRQLSDELEAQRRLRSVRVGELRAEWAKQVKGEVDVASRDTAAAREKYLSAVLTTISDYRAARCNVLRWLNDAKAGLDLQIKTTEVLSGSFSVRR
jgi:hypothetical protein